MTNTKHSNKSIEEGFMLRGALLSPRPESDDKLEKSRVDMQSFSNDIISNQAISDIFQAVIAAPHPMSLDFYRDMCVKIQTIAEENTRTMEPYLVPFIHDYAYIKREVCNAMVNGLQPKRVLDTLLQAPIFSSDTNAFPIDTIKAANILVPAITKTLTETNRRAPTINKMKLLIARPIHFAKVNEAINPQNLMLQRQKTTDPDFKTPANLTSIDVVGGRLYQYAGAWKGTGAPK